MENFRFNAYTNILFGKGEIKNLPNLLTTYGKNGKNTKNILLAYGGGSIKRIGLYQKIKELLSDFNIFELSGIEPNPKITSVREGVAITKENDIDIILAVGGGSVIDCSKVISAGHYYQNDPWDLVLNKDLIDKTLPIVTVLTMAATGSEMNKNAVISNDETKEKLGTASMNFIPQASICDPTYLYSLPAIQTAAGTADIMSHIFENYFSSLTDTFVQDGFAETLLKACIKYCPVALKEPNNYEARANLMWSSTLALNGLLGAGKTHTWSCHPIEHQLSAFYDITHGVGLAIITPRWFRYILNDSTVDKFVSYAKNVWSLPDNEDKFALAKQGIDKTEEFFISCGLPMTLTELGIDSSKFELMAENTIKIKNMSDAYVPLNKDDIVNILNACL